MSFSITTNQKINEYYNKYREHEIMFTKNIIRFLRLDPRQIYVKCAGSQWPCIINSTSFHQSKIIIGTNGGAFQQITKKDAPPVNLRYCFVEPDNQQLIFFVTCRVTDVTPYMNSKELAIVTLSFTQRPSDDLIYKIGSLIDANEGFIYRKEERIILNDDSKRLLGINKKESIVYIQSVPRHCILWNLSFSGAKIIVLGVPQLLENKDCIIKFLFTEPSEIVGVKGTIVSVAPVEGRRELVEAGIKFDENQVPLAYKIRINGYLSNRRKKFLDYATKASTQNKKEEEKTQESKVPQETNEPQESKGPQVTNEPQVTLETQTAAEPSSDK